MTIFNLRGINFSIITQFVFVIFLLLLTEGFTFICSTNSISQTGNCSSENKTTSPIFSSPIDNILRDTAFQTNYSVNSIKAISSELHGSATPSPIGTLGNSILTSENKETTVTELNHSVSDGNTSMDIQRLSATGNLQKGNKQTSNSITFYSYQSGDWNTSTTWTTNPGGTTQTGTSIPTSTDQVVILSNRTVTLLADIAATDLKITINNGGFLDLGIHKFTSVITLLEGEGTVKLASANFPDVTTNTLINANGGTVEYNAGVNLPVSQTVYNNLTINTTGTVIQVNNLSLNGNLIVKQGDFQLNDNTTNRRQLKINGNVVINNGASFTIGSGNTTSTTIPTGINTSVAGPFIDYYDAQSHHIEIMGDFTNNGTARFTNLTYPVYNSFPVNGMATVYFRGSTNNTLTCNNSTDFYNLVVDKGNDKTFALTINALQYSYFRLFGANTAAADILMGATNANPNIKKALWLRNGTLNLKGMVIIPSLSEGSSTSWPTGDFIIPSNAAMILDGANVIVLSTADDYGEVNTAYGVSGDVGLSNGVSNGGNGGIAVLGNLHVKNGYLSTRESTGITCWNFASGQLILDNGTIDTKQIDDASGLNTGLFSYLQTGGAIHLRGRFQHSLDFSSISGLVNTNLNTSRILNGIKTSDGTFHINTNTGSGFTMTGGMMTIYDVCGETQPSYAFYVNCPTSNISITGGTVVIIPTSGTNLANANYLINSNASFGNLIINSSSGTAAVQLNTNPLKVLQQLTIQSGTLDAQSFDISVGGNFVVNSAGIYNSGNNTTNFNGIANQLFSIDGTINNGSTGLSNLTINKTGSTLSISGLQTSLFVQKSLAISTGTFNDGGKTIFIAGDVINSGVHIGTGRIQFNGSISQSIGGNGSGAFQNIELNNTCSDSAPVLLMANTTINGALTFSQNNLFNIGIYNLNLNSGATILNYNSTRFIQTAGNSGDGGVTKLYNSVGSFVFPVGSVSTSHTAIPYYTPATIGFTGSPATFGSVSVIPVGYVHPSTTLKGQSLTYFWRVKSTGFSGIASKSVIHTFNYDQSDVSGTEANYLPALYNRSNYNWKVGTQSNPPINTTENSITDWTTPDNSSDFLDADYTAGDNTTGGGAFSTPRKFYSCINGTSAGSGSWSNASIWSFTGNSGTADTGTAIPGINDIVIISGNDSVSLASNQTTSNTGVQNCASLQIEKGSALDIGYNPGCAFSMVLSHPNGNGNFRLTTSYETGNTFVFPKGDFSEYNQNLGTTELYTTNATAGGTYWLPQGVGSYGNLILSPLGGSNIIFANNNLIVYGNLITRGQNADSWFCPSWINNYPTAPETVVAKTITINGNLLIQGGSLIWYGNKNTAQNFVINGDVVVNTWSGIQAYSDATNQTMSIGGNLINNTNNTNQSTVGTISYVDFSKIPVLFFGSSNAAITNTSGTPRTVFSEVTVNKGTSQATVLTCNIGGILTTPVDNWLTLQNGTFVYARSNPAAGEDFTVSTTSSFTIPSTSGFKANMPGNGNNINILIANSNTDTNDLFLNGKLTVMNGTVYIGPSNGISNNNNDIEYSSGGNSEIEIDGGNLIVNGAIRRNPTNSAGVLRYFQSAGTLTINGFVQNQTNAKLEVLNTGSAFTMSGGTITIVRGGGTTSGDLYLRPGTGTVTGGTILFTQSPVMGPVVDDAQSYLLDATIPLWNMNIAGLTSSSRNALVNLMVSPLALKGNLILNNANSILNAINGSNSINLTINGNLTNNGNYIFGTNNTIFSGDIQTIGGTSITNFYNLQAHPVTSLKLSSSLTVNNNLTISSGQLLNETYSINLLGNLNNNATYDGDAAVGGIILNGTTQQHISGTGTFGRLEINNGLENILDNSITFHKNLLLSSGILNLAQYLLTLGVSSTIEGTGFSSAKMIISDGLFSNIGIKKFFPVISSPTLFTCPIGSGSKYTPVMLTINSNNSVVFIRVNNINDHHPAVLDANNVLQYYWEIESSNLSGFEGHVVLNYLDSDVKVTGSNTESNYMTTELLVPGTNWSKTLNVNAVDNTLTFNYPLGTSSISGEYTAGIDEAIPNTVPQYISKKSGNWTDPTIWDPTNGSTYPCPLGGPTGFTVTIRTEDVVTANENNCTSYHTTINGKLKVVSPYIGHNFGTLFGNGTLYLESGGIPAGRYTGFFDCSSGGTLEFGGDNMNYTLIAGYLYNTVPKLLFTGTGTRVLSNNDIIVCNQLKIDGPTVDNSVYNKKITIPGTFEHINNGVFNSGTGAGATVSFAGFSPQVIGGSTGDFTGINAFNNIEINNASGLTLNGPTGVKGNLLLTSGIISSSSVYPLTISNITNNCVTPTGGSKVSFVDGPLTKTITQGDNFIFPVGKGENLGNLLTLSASQPGIQDWTVEYFNPNTLTRINPLLTAVNQKEYWNVASTSGNRAIINIKWSSTSDLSPIMTQNGITDMMVAGYDGINNYWNQLESTSSGDNFSGSAQTSSLNSMPAEGNSNFTLGCINEVKPTVRIASTDPVCGVSAIPVTLSYGISTGAPYTIYYTKGGIAQTPLSPVTFPASIPTDAAGDIYQLTGFTYNYPSGTLQTGVFDPSTFTSYAVPTTANSGPDQSICGGASTSLAGNTPLTGTGQWSIISGAGGTVITPSDPGSAFKGTNGSSYTLRWTISNGDCISNDDVVILFPLLAVQPSNFTTSSVNVCQSASGVIYTVPNDPTVSSYNWTYSGSGATMSRSSNSITVNFNNIATSGTISVTATNSCNISAPRSLAVTVNQNIWMGTASNTDWGTPANWASQMVPPAGADITFTSTPVSNLVLDIDRTIGSMMNMSGKSIIIPPARILTVNNTIVTDGNTDRILIQADALSANGSLIFILPQLNSAVQATVEMYSKATWDKNQPDGNVYNWQYFGIPVHSVKASPAFDGAYVMRWNEKGDLSKYWLQLNNDSILTPFTGYEITQAAEKKYVFSGALINSDFTADLPYTLGAKYPGQHIFGNPYTAAIDISKITYGDNTEKSVYLYNTGSYSDWNSNTSNLPIGDNAGQYNVSPAQVSGTGEVPGQIPSMQGFLIRTTGTAGSVSIPYSAVVKNNSKQRIPSEVKTETSGKVFTRIEINGSRFSDRVWIFSDPGCTPYYDNGWDGYKIKGTLLTPQLFVSGIDGDYQVNAVEDMNNTLLDFQAGEDPEYKLTFIHGNTASRYAGIYLVDLIGNKTTDITKSGSTYSFVSEPTPVPVNRFKIATVPFIKDTSETISELKLFTSGNTVFVENLSNLKGEMVVYDMMGRYLKKALFSPYGVTAVQINFPSGGYVVKAATDNESISKRILIGKKL